MLDCSELTLEQMSDIVRSLRQEILKRARSGEGPIDAVDEQEIGKTFNELVTLLDCLKFE